MSETPVPSSVSAMLSPGGAVARRLPGFELRPQQLRMAEAVGEAMASNAHLLVEAGTGVGKSFAYLLPAIDRIVNHQERVVVCTHTIALQEQLVEKDIPLLQAAIGDFSAVLVKGRNNYVSLRRLQRASQRQDRLFGDEEVRHALHAVEDWAITTRDGSRASLPVLPPSEVWDAAQSDRDDCMGKRCPSYEQCFYQSARRRMENAQLLVCNHALFFSDLALRADDNGFLPKYHHVILDEAHTVEDVASEHFGLRVAEGGVQHMLRTLMHERTQRGVLGAMRVVTGSEGLVDRAVDSVQRGYVASRAFFDDLRRAHAGMADRSGRVAAAGIVANTLQPALAELANLLKMLADAALGDSEKLECTALGKRAAEHAAAIDQLLEQRMAGCVYWIEASGGGSGGARVAAAGRWAGHGARRRVALCAAPVDVAPALRERLFSKPVSVTLTSATLATGADDFTHAMTRLGCEDAQTLQLGSPFDFARQAKLYVEADLPEPSDPRYIELVAPRILEHIEATDGGAFVLFTSFAMLEQVADRLRPALLAANRPLLVHGESMERTAMVERFRQDDRSVLLGTASFWQGVDVRGRALRNVIIARLPFEVPDRPLVQARHELIEQRGGNPFREDALPKAILKFKQGFGRLIRSATDEGRVVVLDPRLVTKSYGRLFRAALPVGVETIVRRPSA